MSRFRGDAHHGTVQISSSLHTRRPQSATGARRPRHSRAKAFTALGLYFLAACGSDDKRLGEEGDSSTTIDEDSEGNSGASSVSDDRLDLGDGQDGGNEANPDCVDPSGTGELEYKFSVAWIANSGEGTVSRIDTIDAIETARFFTGPNEGPSDNPSRTSVNLVGDVVVGNRVREGFDYLASFTKIIGDPDRCSDLDGDGTVRSSSGPQDILPWGEDECVQWNYGVDGRSGRAVAWDAGEIDACGSSKDPHVWVAWLDRDGLPNVHLLDEWGSFVDGVVIDDPSYFGQDLYGVYGGAVDKEGNFYGTNMRNGGFVRVDRETFEYEVIGGGGYGMTVGADGNPYGIGNGKNVNWVDMATKEAMSSMPRPIGGGATTGRGIAIDANGHLWMAANSPCGVARYDLASGTWTDPLITWDGCEEPVGVSIDFEGHVWLPDRVSNNAVKLRPNPIGEGAEVVGVVENLVFPYTYSDFTGGALNLVVNPPVG